MEFDAATVQEFLELATTLGLRETSYDDLREETRARVMGAGIDDPEKAIESLSAYRPIACVGLRPGDYLRWIRDADASPSGRPSGPTTGGYITAIAEQPSGEHTIKCINTAGRHFQTTTRPGLWLFRRFKDQELVVLSVLAALDQGSMGEPTAPPF